MGAGDEAGRAAGKGADPGREEVSRPAAFRAVELLRSGELVAFPTDTVYGVGAIAWDAAAVARLYTAKLRPAEKAIPILLADPADIALVARDLSPAARAASPSVFGPGR